MINAFCQSSAGDLFLSCELDENAPNGLLEDGGIAMIPAAAITYDAQRNPTVEVADDKAENGRRKVSIKTGVGDGTRTQVLEGLKQGDKVVLPS